MIKAKQLKELGPPEDVEYIERERHAVAVHEACHALVAFRTRQHMEIDIATIEKGSDYLGMVASIPPEDQFTRWRSEYETDILVSLASLAGERMFFDERQLLRRIRRPGVRDHGRLVHGGLLGHGHDGVLVLHGQAAGGRLARRRRGRHAEEGPGRRGEARRALADRIEDNLTTLLDRIEEIIRENRNHVLALAHALETHKTLSGEDVVAVLEHTQGPLVDGTPYADAAFLAAARRLPPVRGPGAPRAQHGAAEPAGRRTPRRRRGRRASWPAIRAAGLNGHNPDQS